MWYRADLLNRWRRLVGVRPTLYWLLVRVCNKVGLSGPESWSVRPSQVQHALTARLRNSSDMRVFSQIFVFEEYATLRDLGDVLLVLDLGANVGFSSAYFLNCFPKSRVLAVEPDGRNLAVCRINLQAYGDRARLLHGAAWGGCMRLSLLQDNFGDGREWATQVKKPHDGDVGDIQAWDVASLIEMSGGTQVDLLKVDIECAELAVFDDNPKRWLPKVRNICIELHNQDCEYAFFHALADFDYELEHSGELTICRNLRAKGAKGSALNMHQQEKKYPC
jgi:FkbM family methyltransferase